MAADLDKPRTIAEIAGMRDIPERTLRRQLVALNLQHDGKVLVRFGTRKRGKWFTTLRTLQEYLPGLFRQSRASKEEVERMQEDLTETKKRLNALAASHRAFQKKAWEWFRR